jgi:hypothetical protein
VVAVRLLLLEAVFSVVELVEGESNKISSSTPVLLLLLLLLLLRVWAKDTGDGEAKGGG